MSDMRSRINEIYSLEQLSGKNTAIHRLHPAVKIISTLTFIICVISFDRYAFERLVPYIFYPVILMALSEIPYSMIFKRVLLALPFCLFAGISNLIFDRGILFRFYGVAVSTGFISFATILFRTLLSVAAVLILVAVTPFTTLTGQMRRMKVPEVFMTLFEMTYRYIGALLEEASSMYTAYQLRSNSGKGIQILHMGSFVGQLLLRSFDRAERIYSAMKCRGYALKDRYKTRLPLKSSDYGFLVIACGLILLFRFVDVPAYISHWIGELLSC